MGRTTKKVLGSDAVRALALREYEAGTPLPKAIRKIDAKANRPTIGLVSPVYFAENGKRNPLPASAAKTARGLRSAIRKRRDSGVRWETVAASASVTLGRPFSVAETKKAYEAGGGNLAASYTGRGTRVAAPETYSDVSVAATATLAK